jgi:uncharacterized protein (DUF4415 family)
MRLREFSGTDLTDWKRIDAVTEEQIEAMAEADEDTPRDLDWTTARLVVPAGKESIHLRIDHDILAWFRASGKGYQTRINAVLRTYCTAQGRSHAHPPQGGFMREAAAARLGKKREK